MSLCGHHFVIVPFQTAQKLSPQFFEKERPCVHACVHASSTCVHTYIYVCSFKWNDSILLLHLSGVNSPLFMFSYNLFTSLYEDEFIFIIFLHVPDKVCEIWHSYAADNPTCWCRKEKLFNNKCYLEQRDRISFLSICRLHFPLHFVPKIRLVSGLYLGLFPIT